MSYSCPKLFVAPTPTDVSVSIGGHVFLFRRMTWRDEMELFRRRKDTPDLHLLSFALTSVDGRAVAPADAATLVMGLPRLVRDRILILYRGSLPGHRMAETMVPPPAPPPAVVQARAEAEVEEDEVEAEDFLTKKFGHEEAEAAREQARLIAANSAYIGTTQALPEGGIDEGPEDGPGGSYMAVM